MHEFKPPGKNDKRSPCPALNVLANYEYLPHDGQNLTMRQYVDALYNGLNCSKTVGWGLTVAAFLYLGVFLKGKLSLDELGEHNKIEHDVSLTRVDNYLGDQCVVNNELVDQLLTQEIDSKITLESLARLRLIRMEQSLKQNEHMTYGKIQRFLAYGESSLLLNFIGHNTNNQIDVKQIETFLKDEKFPDGWTKPNQEITFSMLSKDFNQIKRRVEELEKSDTNDNLVIEGIKFKDDVFY